MEHLTSRSRHSLGADRYRALRCPHGINSNTHLSARSRNRAQPQASLRETSSTVSYPEDWFLWLITAHDPVNDNQEIDWEILTSTISTASACVPAGIWATNQAVTPGTQNTHQTVPFTFDPTADFHEYRIDWSSDATAFYIDGQQKTRFTTNVPTQAGSWIWNTWSNGDPCWSNGPPTANSITQIKSIEIFKGWTSTVSGTICNV